MKIDWSKTIRGFVVGEFEDRYGTFGSIQESSIAWIEDDDEMTRGHCIWVGVERDGPNVENSKRLHLTRDQAGALAKELQRFHDTGEVGYDD